MLEAQKSGGVCGRWSSGRDGGGHGGVLVETSTAYWTTLSINMDIQLVSGVERMSMGSNCCAGVVSSETSFTDGRAMSG